MERREVGAPGEGRFGETTTLKTGAVVHPGERLASIFSWGRLIVAAEFPANAAFGRIQPGQPARMRLDGFPPEIRDSNVRVEFEIQPDSSFRGKLEHGMPGSIDVAGEHVPPPCPLFLDAGPGVP